MYTCSTHNKEISKHTVAYFGKFKSYLMCEVHSGSMVVQAAKSLVSLHLCAVSPEPSLHDNVIVPKSNVIANVL